MVVQCLLVFSEGFVSPSLVHDCDVGLACRGANLLFWHHRETLGFARGGRQELFDKSLIFDQAFNVVGARTYIWLEDRVSDLQLLSFVGIGAGVFLFTDLFIHLEMAGQQLALPGAVGAVQLAAAVGTAKLEPRFLAMLTQAKVPVRQMDALAAADVD